MQGILKSVFVIAAAGCLLILMTGCTTATLVTGLSSAPAGVSYGSGFGSKVYSYQIVQYEDAIAAVEHAAEILALKNSYKDAGETRTALRYIDEKDTVIDIIIERRTASITFIQVDAGYFGPRGMTRLMLVKILDEIGAAEYFKNDELDKKSN